MKAVAEMSLMELAAWVSGHLRDCGIPVVLVGGGCVSVYSENRYQTSDLDFVERYHTRRQLLRAALAEIGFAEESRYFRHPQAAWFLEFPSGPLAIGDSPVEELGQVSTEQGVLVLLTPTDCVKDRLSAYYHWQDRQALEQAVWVAQRQAVDLESVRKWSQQEGMNEKFGHFLTALGNAHKANLALAALKGEKTLAEARPGGMFEQWYEYERQAREQAIREWCCSESIELAD